MRPLLRSLVLIALCLCLAACGALEFVKGASGEVQAALDNAPAFIDARARDGRLTPEEAAAKKESFARLSEQFKPVDEYVQDLEKLDPTAALGLIKPVRAFVRQLDAENIVNAKDPLAANHFAEIDFLLRGLSRRLIARLESRAKGVRQSREALLRDVRETSAEVERLKELMAA